jgi:hypothetical protein
LWLNLNRGAFHGLTPSASSTERTSPAGEFTLRDEANALTAHAFRNGFLEDLHAGKPSPPLQQPGYSRITDDEMKRMLALKQQNPAEYDRFIRKYQKTYCRTWKRG